MDKILDNIYNMGEREFDVFKFLCVALLCAIATFLYFAFRIPYQLEERQRLIDEYYARNASTIDSYRDARGTTGNDYGDFRPEVIYYNPHQ